MNVIPQVLKQCIIMAVIISIGICINPYNVKAQVEHLPISHPVYMFLQHCEAKGLLEHFSLSSLPLQRGEVAEALRSICGATPQLTASEKQTLELYEQEICPELRVNSSVFSSDVPRKDTLSFFSSGLFSENEKGFYFQDENNVNVYAVPLASADFGFRSLDTQSSSMFSVQAGIRVHGTLSNRFGYFMQVTNGSLISGDRTLALEDIRLKQNIKFAVLNSDFDFTESHIRYDYDWFYIGIGRESRLLGAGFRHHQFLGQNAPPLDAVFAGARFKQFEYRFTYASLMSLAIDTNGQAILPNMGIIAGSDKYFPSKTLVMHRAAFRPKWGEIALWESVVYQNRSLDLGYLNPLSFLKSVEHSLRDRDNSAMGFDFTIRPVKGLSIKGSYLLDDLIFSKIGTDYWGNKAAYSLGALYAFPSWNIGAEYAKVYPYTYSHFNVQNSMTSDGQIITGSLAPNSDELSLFGSLWYGNRYPIQFLISYRRHGANQVETINGKDTLLVNHGGDALYCKRPNDSMDAPFLAGIVLETFKTQMSIGYEIIRGFNIQAAYQFRKTGKENVHIAQVSLRFEDF